MSTTGVRGGGKFFVVLERISTVAVIVVALFVVFVYGNSYLHTSSTSPKSAGKYDIPRGKVLALPGVQWQNSKASVVVVLSTKCVYCERSAPFYQKLTALIQQRGGTIKTVAVFPQKAADGQAFLSSHNLAMDQAVSVPLGVLGVHVTPTLLLVDRSGTVQDGWVGSLSVESQTAVLAAVTKSL
jgi:hypothetical protein